MTVLVHSRRVEPEGDVAPVLGELIETLGLAGRVRSGSTVLIKPNFVAPFPAATTDLAVIGQVAEAVRAVGGHPIVGESSGYEFDAESTFKVLGVREFMAARDIELRNLDDEPLSEIRVAGKLVEIARIAREADLVINLPVLKGHTITKVTGAVKNFFGLLSRESRRKLHVSGLHEGIADLAREFPDALHFADARNLLVRAVFSDVRPLGFFLAADEPFALDHFGSRLLGFDPEAVIHLDHVPDYEVSGALPEGVEEQLSRRDSPRDRVHRAMYSAFYLVDDVKSRTVGGRSIIPHLHWTLGVHPEIGDLSDEELRRLADLCPVGAIDVDARRIVPDKCRPVRCMACLRAASEGGIRLGGLNPPKPSRPAPGQSGEDDSKKEDE